MFGDWKEKSKDAQISKSLLWEYDLDNFDWNDMRVTVVQRVVREDGLKISMPQSDYTEDLITSGIS